MRKSTAHTIATWVGVAAILVAISLPVINAFTDAEVGLQWGFLVGALGILFAGSRRVEETFENWIRAWRGHD